MRSPASPPLRHAALAPALLLALAALSAGCLRSTEYRCAPGATSSQCGTGGTCEAVGYCSFADPACDSGRRFAESAGSHANQCVGDGPGGDAGIRLDGPLSDAPAAGCPAGYDMLPGAPPGSHRYRVLATPGTWIAQQGVCGLTSSSAYLVIPDDAAELSAVATLAGTTPFWIGVHDMTTNGAFVTVRGGAATFLPWAAGEPDNNANPAEDCAAAASSTTIMDDRCDTGSTKYIAVCECEP